MTRLRMAALAAAFTTAATFAQADNVGGFYIGAKTGQMDIDVSGISNDRGDGLFLGYEWAVGPGMGLAIEYEFTTTSTNFRQGTIRGDLDMDTHALYGAFRYGETVYFKAKLGVLREEIDIKARPAGPSVSGNDTGLSGGVGVGARLGDHFMIEAEFTIIEEDINYFSIGAGFRF